MEKDLNERICDFITCFELVFHWDWDFTKSSILDKYLIQETGTFIDPYPGEYFTGGKGDNWANRTSLIAAYR